MDDPSTSDTLSGTGGPDSALSIEDTDAVLRAICRDVLGLDEERVAAFDRGKRKGRPRTRHCAIRRMVHLPLRHRALPAELPLSAQHYHSHHLHLH